MEVRLGFDKRELGTPVTPRDGDSLESIAQRASAGGEPISADEIALFNFGTVDREEIDTFLRDLLGARKRDPDNHFLLAPDDRREGELIVPLRFKKSGFATQRVHDLRVVKRKAPKQFVGCCSIPGITFAFDKSFVRPTVVDAMQRLQRLARAHPEAKIMIWGHTDRVGNEVYNKKLSERRARSVYAFIVNDADDWEALYQEEQWGTPVITEILADLAVDEPDLDPGPGGTKAAVKAYQRARGLDPDGVAGKQTRRQLFLDYMSGKHDLKLDPDRFMDPKHMGCGEFNPQIETEEAVEANRRVTFFLFHPERLPTLPCRAGDVAPCRHQMKPPAPRHVASFHCSFFDSIAKRCPVEHGLLVLHIRLHDVEREVMPNARFRCDAGTQAPHQQPDHADAEGIVELHDVEASGRCLLEWGPQEGSDFPYSLELHLDFDEGGSDEENARRRLHNLGYSREYEPAQTLKAFQQDYALAGQPGVTEGSLDAVTKARLWEIHDTALADQD